MIDRYSFLDIEELTEQRGHIKKISKNMRGKIGGVGGVRDRKRAQSRSEGVLMRERDTEREEA